MGVASVSEDLSRRTESAAASLQETVNSIGEISSAITVMDQATQQNAAMVEQTSAAARNLSTEVEALKRQALTFTVDRGVARRPIGGGALRHPAAARAATPRYIPPASVTSPATTEAEWASF